MIFILLLLATGIALVVVFRSFMKAINEENKKK